MQNLQEFETDCNPVTARAIVESDQRLKTLVAARKGGFVSDRYTFSTHMCILHAYSWSRVSLVVTKLRGFTLNAMLADVSLPPLIRLSMAAERVASNAKSSLLETESRRCRIKRTHRSSKRNSRNILPPFEFRPQKLINCYVVFNIVDLLFLSNLNDL